MNWEIIKKIGGGGQSDVFLVRSEKRTSERSKCLEDIRSSLDRDERAELATAIFTYSRDDFPNEIGALKRFKIPPESPASFSPSPDTEEYEAIKRLNNEISCLSKNQPGLLKLLDSNVAERWIVTEYLPKGTLETNPSKYRGKVAHALEAFKSLVQTVVSLHKEGSVHRDIKPANVFIGNNDDLVLGDFGIVYIPNGVDRVTHTKERVGPRDYMPPWANTGTRFDSVQPNFDVYMLGKLLWSMIAGRAVLPREYHNTNENFNLTKIFPNDPHMYLANDILDKCVVEFPEKCLSSAQELLEWVNPALEIVSRGGQILKLEVPRPCRICGVGIYRQEHLSVSQSSSSIRFWPSGRSETRSLTIDTFICNACGHVQFFRTTPGQNI